MAKTKIQDKKNITIGNKKFTIESPKMVQYEQIQEMLKIDIMAGIGAEASKILMKNIKNLITFVAIIVIEEGVPLDKKNVEEVRKYISCHADVKQFTEMITFFFNAWKKNLTTSQAAAIQKKQGGQKKSKENTAKD